MRGGVQVGSKCNHCVTEHNLTINGENNRIILRESQEMKKFVFIKENPREKVIGMQTIQQQGPGSKSLLDAWVGIIFLPHVCSILICPDPLPLLMEIQRKKEGGWQASTGCFWLLRRAGQCLCQAPRKHQGGQASQAPWWACQFPAARRPARAVQTPSWPEKGSWGKVL